jgi:hypothetical protein
VNVSIPRLPIDSFTWLRWVNNDIWAQLGMRCRYRDMLDNKRILRKYAVGYREAETIVCRPKTGEVAVLFLINGRFSWTHLRRHEFEEVFCET